MPSTIDLRRRIRSVKSTQQITRAMKMVSAAKLRRAQERMMAARPYSAALREVLRSISTRVDVAKHELLQEPEQESRVLLVVVTADRGLAGAFNTNIIRAAQNAIAEKGWQQVELVVIGRRGYDFFKRRTTPIRRHLQLMQALSLDNVRELAESMIKDFVGHEFDAIYVLYNEFKSVIAQRVTLERLLPLQREWAGADENEQPSIEYLYEPSPEQILGELLPKHIEFQLYRVLLESAAAEQGARMTAMEAATKNASDMISHLTLTYNRIRQASITKEIIEIVSGASAAGH